MSNNIHQMSAPGGPQMNKYEQLSSRGHQMPLAGGPSTVRSHVLSALGPGPGESLYGEFTSLLEKIPEHW